MAELKRTPLFAIPIVVMVALLLAPPSSAQVYLPLLLRDSPTATETATATVAPTATETPTPTDRFLVTRIIDGDTIELSTGERVRYIGIDTPEGGDCYADEATAKNAELVLNQWVRLVKDVSETDRYGRLLRYVYVREGPDELFVNAELVRGGYAFVYTYPPDVAFAELFLQLQQEAREAGRGLWSACVTLTPTETATVTPTATATWTPTETATDTPTATETWTATSTATSTATPSFTPTATRTNTTAPTATFTRTPTPSPTVGQIVVEAWVNDDTPAKYSTVVVYGKITQGGVGISGVPMETTWYYKTTTVGCSGTTGSNGVASCSRSIGNASAGYYVTINVALTYQGHTYYTSTGFTPH